MAYHESVLIGTPRHPQRFPRCLDPSLHHNDMPGFFALMSHVYGVWRVCPNHGEPPNADGRSIPRGVMLGDDAGGTIRRKFGAG